MAKKNLTGQGLANFAKSKKGTPYVYGAKGANGKLTQSYVNMMARMYPSVFTSNYLYKIKSRGYVGKVCTDCSGLISWYTGVVLGSEQMYSTASKRIAISKWKTFPIGTVLYKKGHVGVYLGDGKVAEAKGIDYGTIISNISSTKWTYGLLFSYISYDNTSSTVTEEDDKEVTSVKGENPYKMPTAILRKGSTGSGVKWLQWELVEAGHTLAIDGDFGDKTLAAVKSFQKSAKLVVDGEVGNATKKALTVDPEKGNNPYKEPSKTIKSGSKGTGVKWVQWELVEADYKIDIDGDFGPKTLAAVKSFQKKYKLEVDGKVGPATRKALRTK